ncbi:hypothetical protein [Asanoa ferruginea]|nr:hypothetical protein [Asanoa ferruginea]
MTSHTSPATAAVMLAAVSLSLAGCGISDDQADPTWTVGAASTPALETGAPQLATKRLRVASLMKTAGCKGKVIGTQLYSYETGRCQLAGGEVTLAVFDTAENRTAWVDAGAAFGGTAVTGKGWAAVTDAPDTAAALAEKLDGKVGNQ